MERIELYRLPDNMIVPYTYSFPLIRQSGLPREFRGDDARRGLLGSIYTMDFEYSFPPYR